MDYASLLNKDQLAAVTTSSQYVRIVAGAGSGKTRVLTYRISYLIGEVGVDPTQILAITFTNKAAKEMKDRVIKLVPSCSRLLQVSTFHSFCAKFLRMEHRAIGYPVGFTIYDEDDQKTLIKNIAADLGYKKSDPIVKSAYHYIGDKKMRGLYPDDISCVRESFNGERVCLKIFTEYERRKTDMLALDFDDLMMKTIEVLETYDEIRYAWMDRFSHILIDEFQDTNDVQYKLVKLFMRPDTSLYVVGDPDQTIYTWRGANQKIILDFEFKFDGAETIILDRNYRSTKNILDASNRLISNNLKRVKKNLYTNEKNGDPVMAQKFYSAEEEAKWVVNKIAALGRLDGGDFTNIAILYRSSYVTRAFEHELMSKQIPYRIFGGLRFYERMEVKDVLAYFRLITNHLDDVAFERIANVPKRGVGDSSLELLKEEAKNAGMSCYDYLSHVNADVSNLPKRVINSLGLMIQKVEDVKKKLAQNEEAYSAILKEFITSIGYFDYIAEMEDLDEDRVGNVNALFDDITHYINENPESTFEEYLQNVALFTSQDDMNGGNYVSLMTVHTAKGLEFDYVFLIYFNDGVFPNGRAINEEGREGLEEERRLAYVAMTRAKQNLYMTCNSAYSFQTDSRGMPSQFFEEAGVEIPKSGFSTYGDRRPTYSGGYGQRPSRPTSYFGDGDSINPFEEKPKPVVQDKPKNNGITDWKVGDVVRHDKFGDGVVIEMIDSNIVIINFEGQGRKTLVASHPSLHRISSKGGQA